MTHLADILASADNPSPQSIDELQGWLDEAEEIFQINGAFREQGRVSQLKASFSAREQKFSKANEQAERGRRLADTYEPSTVAETHRSISGTPALAGAQN